MAFGSVKMLTMGRKDRLLWTSGGRTQADILIDRNGEYILMWNGETHEYLKKHIKGSNEEGFWLRTLAKEV